MSSFVFISITALYFYAFLMLAFLTAKKSKLITDFIAVLFTMILWTGGSLLMRLQAWPGYRLWYHFSLAGICSFAIFIITCSSPLRTDCDFSVSLTSIYSSLVTRRYSLSSR